MLGSKRGGHRKAGAEAAVHPNLIFGGPDVRSISFTDEFGNAYEAPDLSVYNGLDDQSESKLSEISKEEEDLIRAASSSPDGRSPKRARSNQEGKSHVPQAKRQYANVLSFESWNGPLLDISKEREREQKSSSSSSSSSSNSSGSEPDRSFLGPNARRVFINDDGKSHESVLGEKSPSGPPRLATDQRYQFLKATKLEVLRMQEQQERADSKLEEENSRALAKMSDDYDKKETEKKRLEEEAFRRRPAWAKLPFAAAFDELEEAYRQTEQEGFSRKMVFLDPIAAMEMKKNRAVSLGWARYNELQTVIRKVCAANGIRLEPLQTKFVEEFAIACAPLLFGTDWETEKDKFFRKYKIVKHRRFVLALTPRRFGKTWSICIFTLAILIVIPKIQIAVISQNLRTSVALVEMMKGFLHRLPDYKMRLARITQTQIEVIPALENIKGMSASQKEQYPDKATIVACPSTADGKPFFSFFLAESAAAAAAAAVANGASRSRR